MNIVVMGIPILFLLICSIVEKSSAVSCLDGHCVAPKVRVVRQPQVSRRAKSKIHFKIPISALQKASLPDGQPPQQLQGTPGMQQLCGAVHSMAGSHTS